MVDKVKQELLLTKSQAEEVAHNVHYRKRYASKEDFTMAGAKAQLAKAEPLIRKDERERIMSKIEITFSDTITKGVMTATNAWQALKGEGK